MKNDAKSKWLDMVAEYGLQTVYPLFRLFWIFLENLPIGVAYGLAEVMGRIAYRLAGRRRTQIYQNLEIVYPGGAPLPKQAFAQRVFIHLCCVFVETALSRRLVHRHTWRNYINGAGVAALTELKAEYGQAVLASLHLGNFMVAGYTAVYTGHIPVTVIHPWQGQGFMQFFANFFERIGHTVVIKQEAYEILQTMAGNGYSPLLLSDQHAGRKAPYLDFLGRPAYSAVGPAALARRFHLPFYIGAMVRIGRFRFNLLGMKLPPIVTEDKQADLEAMTLRLNQEYGKMILQYPEQWFWMHRRWR